ncbi:MAG: hypothetical protein K2Q22_05115, partial [Cytophagales bacterium]|nr:hypothetical protein [Cytophagales bacterium]
MKKLAFFLIFISHAALGQGDELFSQLMDNKTYLSIPDRSDSTLMAQIISLQPKSGYARFCLAYFAYKNGDPDLCQALLDTLFSSHTGINKFTFVLKGVFYEAIGNAAIAMESYNASLRLSPGFILALSHRGLLNYHMDNLFDAENDFKQIL